MILFIQTLALYKSFTYLLTYLLNDHFSALFIANLLVSVGVKEFRTSVNN